MHVKLWEALVDRKNWRREKKNVGANFRKPLQHRGLSEAELSEGQGSKNLYVSCRTDLETWLRVWIPLCVLTWAPLLSASKEGLQRKAWPGTPDTLVEASGHSLWDQSVGRSVRSVKQSRRRFCLIDYSSQYWQCLRVGTQIRFSLQIKVHGLVEEPDRHNYHSVW